mmetsp:Transcript_21861/g.72420  ORF Transcript_21861/g.72420 Transcript_21861/m.72420 type:complete len:220 (+) Transcript_21861:110-769(+)
MAREEDGAKADGAGERDDPSCLASAYGTCRHMHMHMSCRPPHRVCVAKRPTQSDTPPIAGRVQAAPSGGSDCSARSTRALTPTASNWRMPCQRAPRASPSSSRGRPNSVQATARATCSACSPTRQSTSPWPLILATPKKRTRLHRLCATRARSTTLASASRCFKRRSASRRRSPSSPTSASRTAARSWSRRAWAAPSTRTLLPSPRARSCTWGASSSGC